MCMRSMHISIIKAKASPKRYANLLSFINTDVAHKGNISIIKAKASQKRYAGTCLKFLSF